MNHRKDRLRLLVRGGVSLFFFLLCFGLTGQGYERYLEAEEIRVNEGKDVVQTIDEGFVFCGSKDLDKAFSIYKLDPYGKILWIFEIPLGTNNFLSANSIIEASNGDIIAAGYCDGCEGGGQEDPIIVRLNAAGEVIWSQDLLGTGSDERLNDIIELPNGNLAAVGTRNVEGDNDFYLLILDSEGNQVSESTFRISEDNDIANAVIISATGDLAIAGQTNQDISLLSTSAAGDSLWYGFYPMINGQNGAKDLVQMEDGTFAMIGTAGSVSFGSQVILTLADEFGNFMSSHSYGEVTGDRANSIKINQDGNLVIAGGSEITGAQSLPAIWIASPSGNELYFDRLSDPSEPLIIGGAEAVCITTEGNYGVIGQKSTDDNALNKRAFYFAKLVDDGSYLRNTIKGNIYFDSNTNCSFDALDFGLRGWNVVLRGDKEWFGSSDLNGDFEIFAPVGSYTLDLVPPGENIWTACVNSYNITISAEYQVYELDFPVREDKSCYDLQLDIATPYLSPCQNSIYNIRYGNDGTVAATGAYIDVDLDESLTLVDSEIAAVDLGNNSYRFNFPVIGILAKDSFNIEVAVDCDAIAGRAHRLAGTIFPNEPCDVDPDWNGSSIEVNATCNLVDDVLVFSNENVGTDGTTGVLNSIIIEDHLMYRVIEPLELEGGEIDTMQVPASGATYRMVTLQSEKHPGKSRPTISLEGCTNNIDYSTGFATEWPEDDYDDFKAVSHEENIDLLAQTDQFKRGYPKGFDEENLINSDTDLNYQINFRNNTADTAIRVVIRDTISNLLDPSTIVPGASSHDYTYEVYGNGILKFTFENIDLPPDSGAESMGYVKYRISQKPNNPTGALIKSGATIYLAYQQPQYTGTTCHKLNDSLFVRVIPEPIVGLTKVEAYPNPFKDQTTVFIDGSFPIQKGILRVYNGIGQLLSVKPFTGKEIEILRSEVAAGALFFQIENDGQLLATGQLIAQ